MGDKMPGAKPSAAAVPARAAGDDAGSSLISGDPMRMAWAPEAAATRPTVHPAAISSATGRAAASRAALVPSAQRRRRLAAAALAAADPLASHPPRDGPEQPAAEDSHERGPQGHRGDHRGEDGERQAGAERAQQLGPGHRERSRGGRHDDARGHDDRRELRGGQPGRPHPRLASGEAGAHAIQEEHRVVGGHSEQQHDEHRVQVRRQRDAHPLGEPGHDPDGDHVGGGGAGQRGQRCAYRPEPQADDQRDGQHGEQLDPLEVLPDDLALVVFGRDRAGHAHHVVGRAVEEPVHVGVRARGLRPERGARPEVQERDDRGGLLVRPVQQACGVGQREGSGQPGDTARRPWADRAGQYLGGVRLAGLGQRRRGRGLLGQLHRAGRIAARSTRDGLADRPVPGGRRHPVRVALHDGHGRVDGEAEQPGRVAFRVGGGRPGGIRSDRPPRRRRSAAAGTITASTTAAAQPPTMRYRRPTTTNAYPRARMPAAGHCFEGSTEARTTPDLGDYRRDPLTIEGPEPARRLRAFSR